MGTLIWNMRWIEFSDHFNLSKMAKEIKTLKKALRKSHHQPMRSNETESTVNVSFVGSWVDLDDIHPETIVEGKR